MALENSSLVNEFILLGITDQPDLKIPLFLLFLIIYMITALGNLTLIILIMLNSHLHTPMYFFLFNLSCIDLCFSSVITPKMLTNFIQKQNVISYMGCMTQLYFFCFFVISECHVLTSMAYDRYVAICNPLMYNVALSPKVCSYLMLGSYLMGLSGAMIHTGCILRLTFCDGNIINHYFCDLLPLMQLSCTSTYVNQIELFIVTGKDSTCSSHIIAVSMFFGSSAFMYLKPSSAVSTDEAKFSSIFYSIVVPMMNPLIYSLRTKDVKVALKKTLSRMF